jgi:DNA-binding NarL/FixJ family response regulator
MKTLVCDDHPSLRKGIIMTLKDDCPDMQFTEAFSGEEALEKLHQDNFDLVLLDISLPGKNGFAILEQIKKSWPLIPVLMLTGVPENGQASLALEMGASGYLTKQAISEELVLAVKLILLGEKYFARELSNELLHNEKAGNNPRLFDQLSKRQKEVALLLASGYSQEAIAEKLFISPKTVSAHKSCIMDILGLTEDAQLTIYCIQQGLIKAEDIVLDSIKNKI